MEWSKLGLHEIMPVNHKLFTTILNLGITLLTWCGGLITPIYKSGGRSDPLITGVFVSQAV